MNTGGMCFISQTYFFYIVNYFASKMRFPLNFNFQFIFMVYYTKFCLCFVFEAEYVIVNFTKVILINLCLLENNVILVEDAEKMDLIHTHCGSVAGRERLIME